MKRLAMLLKLQSKITADEYAYAVLQSRKSLFQLSFTINQMDAGMTFREATILFLIDFK